MNQGIIAAILSIIFYLTSLLGGSNAQPTAPLGLVPVEQQTVSSVMGKRAVVLGDTISLRSGPDLQYQAVTALPGGTEVTILQAENGWYKVRYGQGRDGWIPGNSVALQEAEQGRDKKLMVLGYYFLGGPSFGAMLEHGTTLTSISPWSWALRDNGTLVEDFDPRGLGESLLFAGNHGLKTYALIHSAGTEHMAALLTNPGAQRTAVANIKKLLQEWGVHGVHFHLADIPPNLRDELTAFVAETAAALKEAGLETSIAVPAKTANGQAGSAATAYDYAALGREVDFMVITAYDQHHQGSSPGPIAGADWVEEVVQYAVSQVSPEKLVLGIPVYGYHWFPTGQVQTITHVQAMELAAAEGIKVRWHSQHKVPYFENNGEAVWFENRYSVQAKLHIAETYELTGIALWPLGQEDTGIWKVLDQAS
ncbi:MAG: SH3 domain-containing protein [Firmicutes bacterium]|nr:SH3 domain-containing protein [Bacillota bacterium]